MALQMKTNCEKCARKLGPEDEAYICSYECTYCRSCFAKLESRCPKCSGDLVVRPVRLPK